MPDVFVPPELAASFVAYMNSQGATLPPAFTELSSRLSNALATSAPTPVASFSRSQPIHAQAGSSVSASTAVRETASLPRRALMPRRMHSLPPEDGRAGAVNFLAGA